MVSVNEKSTGAGGPVLIVNALVKTSTPSLVHACTVAAVDPKKTCGPAARIQLATVFQCVHKEMGLSHLGVDNIELMLGAFDRLSANCSEYSGKFGFLSVVVLFCFFVLSLSILPFVPFFFCLLQLQIKLTCCGQQMRN